MILDLVDEGSWKPLIVTRTGLSLSHLFLTNDIVLFPEALVQQMEVIRSCLDSFCAWSGQRVGFAKYSIFFSSNVSSELLGNIVVVADILTILDLRIYLEAPILHGRAMK